MLSNVFYGSDAARDAAVAAGVPAGLETVWSSCSLDDEALAALIVCATNLGCGHDAAVLGEAERTGLRDRRAAGLCR